MSDDKLAERATAYIAKQRAQFTDGLSAIHTAHLRLQAALDVAIKERAEARADVDRLRGDRDKMLLNERDFVRKNRAEIDLLTRERDEARYFLKIFVHAHASGNAVPPHIEEEARKALEAKP